MKTLPTRQPGKPLMKRFVCPWQNWKTRIGKHYKAAVPAGPKSEVVAGYFWTLNPEGSESQKTIPIDAAW
jgi:hypothetical protein